MMNDERRGEMRSSQLVDERGVRMMTIRLTNSTTCVSFRSRGA